MGDVDVRLRPPGQPWQHVGRELFPEATVEQLSAAVDPWGFSTVGFQVRRDPRLPSPDLQAFVPCEVDEGGARIFEGWVHEAPGTSGDDPLISVSGRGTPNALDDDVLERLYAHGSLGGWYDARQHPAANLTRGGTAAGQVEVGDQGLSFGWPQGAVLAVAGPYAGVTLDLGERSNYPAAVSIDFTVASRTASGSLFSLRLRAATNPDVTAAGGEDLLTADLTSYGVGAQQTVTRNVVTRRRYLHFRLQFVGATGGTLGEDNTVQVQATRVFGSEHYHASGRSILRVSDVVKDAFAACPDLADPVVEPETFAGEAAALVPVRWLRLIDATDTQQQGNATAIGGVALNQSATPPLTSGETSRYATFDGVDDALSLARPVERDFTLFLLVRTTQSVGTGAWTETNGVGLLDASAGAPDDFGMGLVAGKPSFHIDGDDIQIATVVNDGRWHTVALTRSAENGRASAYRDGARDGPYTGLSTAALTAAATMYLGRLARGSGFFAGDIAEPLIFDVELPPDAVAELHRAAIARVAGGIKRTLTSIPEYVTSAPRSFRELVEGGNVFHRYLPRVGRDLTPLFKPPPTVPKFRVGAWSTDVFDDASRGSGEEIYNHALVVGQQPDGTPLRIDRWASQQPGVTFEADPTAPTLANPSFATDAAGWTAAGGGAIARSTADFDSAPAAGLWTPTDGDDSTLTAPFTGTFRRGVSYIVQFRVRSTLSNISKWYQQGDEFNVALTVSATEALSLQTIVPGLGLWQTVTLSFTPNADYASGSVVFTGPRHDPVAGIYLDSFTIRTAKPTALDRLGRVRTKTLDVSMALGAAEAQSAADAFLRSHQRSQLKAQVPVGPGDLVDYRTGAEVHPRYLVDSVGELIHFGDQGDPDTGAHGRDGQVVGLTYDTETEIANVAIDNQRDNFEAMMERFGLFSSASSGPPRRRRKW